MLRTQFYSRHHSIHTIFNIRKTISCCLQRYTFSYARGYIFKLRSSLESLSSRKPYRMAMQEVKRISVPHQFCIALSASSICTLWQAGWNAVLEVICQCRLPCHRSSCNLSCIAQLVLQNISGSNCLSLARSGQKLRTVPQHILSHFLSETDFYLQSSLSHFPESIAMQQISQATRIHYNLHQLVRSTKLSERSQH